jgi:hypothetical protein
VSLERYRENDPSCQMQEAVAAAVSECEASVASDARRGV